jgi:hypothetical protein
MEACSNIGVSESENKQPPQATISILRYLYVCMGAKLEVDNIRDAESTYSVSPSADAGE